MLTILLERLFELVTGQPWRTTRSAVAEFGPTVATLYPEEIAAMSDAELYRYTPAELRQLMEDRYGPR